MTKDDLRQILELVKKVQAMVDELHGGHHLAYRPESQAVVFRNFGELAERLQDDRLSVEFRLSAAHTTTLGALKYLRDFIADERNPLIDRIWEINCLCEEIIRGSKDV